MFPGEDAFVPCLSGKWPGAGRWAAGWASPPGASAFAPGCVPGARRVCGVPARRRPGCREPGQGGQGEREGRRRQGPRASGGSARAPHAGCRLPPRRDAVSAGAEAPGLGPPHTLGFPVPWECKVGLDLLDLQGALVVALLRHLQCCLFCHPQQQFPWWGWPLLGTPVGRLYTFLRLAYEELPRFSLDCWLAAEFLTCSGYYLLVRRTACKCCFCGFLYKTLNCWMKSHFLFC